MIIIIMFLWKVIGTSPLEPFTLYSYRIKETFIKVYPERVIEGKVFLL